MASKGFIITISIIITILAILCTIAAINNNKAAEFDTSDYQIKSHKVIHGDTLWEIGEYCKDDFDDVRAWIDAVRKLNRMTTSGLVVGDYIDIYVAKNR